MNFWFLVLKQSKLTKKEDFSESEARICITRNVHIFKDGLMKLSGLTIGTVVYPLKLVSTRFVPASKPITIDLDMEICRSIDLDFEINSIDRSLFRATSISSYNSVDLDIELFDIEIDRVNSISLKQ